MSSAMLISHFPLELSVKISCTSDIKLTFLAFPFERLLSFPLVLHLINTKALQSTAQDLDEVSFLFCLSLE